MIIIPRNLYKHDGKFYLVVSVVDGVAICVDASTSGKPADWKLFPEKEFSEKAEDLGEFLRNGTYENQDGDRMGVGLGPTILCELMGPEPGERQVLLPWEILQLFHAKKPVYKHVTDHYDA